MGVVQGVLEYNDLLADKGDERPQVSDNHWACEVALWAADVTVSGPFVAEFSRCEIINVDASRFRNVAKTLPGHSMKMFSKYAEDFVNKFNETAVDGYWTNPLFNEKKAIDALATRAHKIYRL